MISLDKILEAINKINVEQSAIEAIEETKDTLIRLNKDQLKRGKAGDGELIGRYKNARYAKIKNQQNPLPGYGNKDLYKSGRYQGEIYARVSGRVIEMGSADNTAQYLEGKKPLYGLYGENKREYVEGELRIAFCNSIAKSSGLKFK